MMTPAKIVNRLQEYIPRFTDLFTTIDNVAAEIVDGTPQTLRVTLAGHGYSAGDSAVFYESRIDNSITGVQQFDNVLRFTTNYSHDLSEGFIDNENEGKIELSGFTDAGLNTLHDIISVPDENAFEIEYQTLPTLTGSEVLREIWQEGLEGVQTVDSVIDVDTFVISLDGKPVFQPGQVPRIKLVSEYRISTAVDFDRAQEIYTKQDTGKAWMFVIFDNVVSSKDRNIESDAISTNGPGQPQRQRVIGNFDIIVLLPTVDSLTGGNAIEIAYNELFIVMLSVITGMPVDTFDTNFVVSFSDHGTLLYNKAYYGHGYRFEYPFDFTLENTTTTKTIKTRALRKINGLDFKDGFKIVTEIV